MKSGPFDTFSPEAVHLSLPLRLEQRASVVSGILRLAVLVPAVVVMLVPFGMVAAHGIADSGTRAAIAANPLSTLQLLAAMLLWLALFAWPAKRTFATLARSRLVEVADGTVTVHERALGREHVWHLPVTAFAGLAHNVRSSLSGVRHELELVHSDAKHSVLIAVAPRMADHEIASVAGLLGRPVLPAAGAAAGAVEAPMLNLARA